jgi:hypothetical protein
MSHYYIETARREMDLTTDQFSLKIGDSCLAEPA